MLGNYEEWLKNVSKEEKQQLLSIKDNPKEIEERFALQLSFGTAGMRGEIGLGTFRMNQYTVKRATAGLAAYIASLGTEKMRQGVIISYDTRRFSREFAFQAAEVLAAFKIKVFIFEDVRPVAMLSFAIRKFKATAGIMITASHNPKEYNGFKVYGSDGAQMGLDATEAVVKFINQTGYFNIPTFSCTDNFSDHDIYSLKGKDNLRLNNYVTVMGKSLDIPYYETIEKLALSKDFISSAKNIKLVYTPIHGAGYVPVTTIFSRLGISADIVESQAAPDCEFSTVEVPNPENPDALKLGIELGLKINADVVLATDPDCDRLGVAIRNNNDEFILLTGNQIGVLLLEYICLRLTEKEELTKNSAAIKSLVSTNMAKKICDSYGVRLFDVQTGFKFIGEKIKEWEESNQYDYIFGFEESYGTLRGTHARDKDAVVGSMLFAEMLIYYESKGISVYNRLIELYEKHGYYYELNISIAYKGLSGMSKMAQVMEKLRSTQISSFSCERVLEFKDYLNETPSSNMLYYTLKEGQFVCVRPSGTEPKLKVYVLSQDSNQDKAKKKAEKIIEDVKKLL